jgi:sugar transferase (PEP-CTERM/EpsH1 system associated)
MPFFAGASMTSQQVPLVAHVIYALGTGGLENGLVNIINRCPPERYRHVIICLTTAQAFAQRIAVPGVQVIELNKREGQDWSMYWRLLRLLRELNPEILHTRNLAALDVQVLGMFLPGVKQVHGEHGRDIYDLDGLNRKYRLLRKAMRLFVDRYIAVSRDLHNWLLETINARPGRVRQIYNGVDHEKFLPRSGDRPDVLPPGFAPAAPYLIIGTVGRLVSVKDQQLIFSAVSELLALDDGWRERVRVMVVGDGPLRKELERQIAEMKLESMVWLPGDREDIPALLQAMDIFVLPSLAEGISNTILEAMSAALPVIATDTGGNPELITHDSSGLLIPVGSSSALCQAILSLLESAALRRRLGDEGLRQVREQFDWNRTVWSYLEIYDDLLGKPAVDGGETIAGKQAGKLEAG